MWRLALEGEAQGIWFWAAVYTCIVCLYSFVFQLRTRFWPCTEGELKQIGIEKFGATEWTASNQDYVSRVRYDYHVAGVAYIGKRISPWIFVASRNARFVLEKQMGAVQRLPDGKVRVFYNPANPRKSYLIVAGKTGIGLTLVIGMLPPLGFYLEYFA